MATAAQIIGGPITQLGSYMSRSKPKPINTAIPGMQGQTANAAPSNFNKLNQPQMTPISQGPGTGQDQSWGQWFKEQAFGRNESFNQVPTVTPQIMELLQQILGQAGEGLQDPYAGFEPIAQQAREQFSTDTVPGLAERFSALGSGGSQRSSAFQGALGSAGAGLDRGLAALQAQYGLQNRDSLVNQFRTGLYPQFENLHRPGTSGAVGEAWNTGKQASMQMLKLLPYLM